MIRWCTVPETWCVTDGWTDGRTDGGTEKVTYRGGCHTEKWNRQQLLERKDLNFVVRPIIHTEDSEIILVKHFIMMTPFYKKINLTKKKCIVCVYMHMEIIKFTESDIWICLN